GLTGLRSLRLGGTRVTDAGLDHLKGMAALMTLHLDRTGVTDAGLDRLKPLTRLRSLGLFGTQATEDGVKALQEAIPGLKGTRGIGALRRAAPDPIRSNPERPRRLWGFPPPPRGSRRPPVPSRSSPRPDSGPGNRGIGRTGSSNARSGTRGPNTS